MRKYIVVRFWSNIKSYSIAEKFECKEDAQIYCALMNKTKENELSEFVIFEKIEF